jgi:hypothetical protein
MKLLYGTLFPACSFAILNEDGTHQIEPYSVSLPPVCGRNSFRPVRSNLSAIPFQRNNNVFLSQQINISISRFSSQPNTAYLTCFMLLYCCTVLDVPCVGVKSL